MNSIALCYVAIMIYACVRFGINCVYADKEDTVHPGWSVCDNLILFGAAFSAITMIAQKT